MEEQNNSVNSLAHTKWRCKYHIVFAPKYRRKVFYEEKGTEVREIIRTLCTWKGVEIIEGEICYTFAFKYTAKDEYIGIYGIFKRKK